ncbi:hypothetical protein [Sphingomonas sp. S6]|jgi:transcriptional regulator of nitric oxide reductase|uniref:hypothetical protein n=1 Tax=Sphingomonas sp. S6 TaxID=3368600 RepID=UPI00373DF259
MKRGIQPATLRQMDRLADLMADGCPSITEAAYRMRTTQQTADRCWQLIRRELGRQAV